MKNLILAFLFALIPVSVSARIGDKDHNRCVIVYSSGAQYADGDAGAGDTDEETAYQWTVPGGLMGPNGWMVVEFGVAQTSSANNKTYRLKSVSGTNTHVSVINGAAAGQRQYFRVNNRNSQSSQWNGINISNQFSAGTPNATTAVDTSVDVVWSLTLQKATGTETLTGEGLSATVCYAP